MKKVLKVILIALVIICAATALVACISLASLGIKTKSIQDDYSAIFNNDKYRNPVNTTGVEVITQDVSCGYAVIEMFSAWNGGNITEETLYDEYGKVVTSTGKSFAKEMNKQFPEYQTQLHKWQKNTEVIDIIYDNLSRGIPVPIEWAALYGDEWTLHYSLVTELDVPNDKITVANPYGYWEELTIEEFLNRTSFEAYENMPIFFKLGFAVRIFEKNAVFSVK